MPMPFRPGHAVAPAHDAAPHEINPPLASIVTHVDADLRSPVRPPPDLTKIWTRPFSSAVKGKNGLAATGTTA